MDPCGIVCVFLIYMSIGYADYVVAVWLVTPIFGDTLWAAIHLTIFNTLLFLTLFAHFRVMLTDPGVVPINKTKVHNRRMISSSEEDEDSESEVDAVFLREKLAAGGEDWTMCTRCQSFRPPRAHHCRVCKRCIRRMDHHCPWVNNCVGEFNQKYFLQFLFYVGVTSFYSILLIIISWVYDDEYASTGMKGPYGENAHHTKVLHTIFLSMESVLFGMFVLAVSCDQLNAIFSEETAVEATQRRGRKQYKRARRRSRVALLREVCGGGSVWSWFLPCFSFPVHRDVILYPREVGHFDI
ncbi:unnamed protein product [Auanema sp. JU1783]|nr:unnamed protein product [Auanema sp. JU1783]